MFKIITLILCTVFMLSGCFNVKVAQTPNEYRQEVSQSKDARRLHESYTVKRSLAAITKQLNAKAKECLNYRFVRTFSMQGTQFSAANQSFIQYNPKIIKSKDRTELYVQMDITGDVMLTYTPPPNGVYVLVADISSKGSKASQVNLYYDQYKKKLLPTSVKNWIAGKNTACPELKEDMASGT